jgi:hypothetical protein
MFQFTATSSTTPFTPSTADYSHSPFPFFPAQPNNPNPRPHPSPLPSSDAPNDVWYCSECGSLNCDWVDVCPVCGQGTK